MGNKKKEREASCGVAVADGCCKLEALVSVDERGQIVLPKELREKIGIEAGDKLAVMVSGKAKACCIMLMPVKELTETIKKALGPLVQELTK